MYAKNDLKVDLRNDITHKSCDGVESLCLKLHKSAENSNLLVGLCYRSLTKDDEEFQLVSKAEKAGKQDNSIIMCNFNYPYIDWNCMLVIS